MTSNPNQERTILRRLPFLGVDVGSFLFARSLNFSPDLSPIARPATEIPLVFVPWAICEFGFSASAALGIATHCALPDFPFLPLYVVFTGRFSDVAPLGNRITFLCSELSGFGGSSFLPRNLIVRIPSSFRVFPFKSRRSYFNPQAYVGPPRQLDPAFRFFVQLILGDQRAPFLISVTVIRFLEDAICSFAIVRHSRHTLSKKPVPLPRLIPFFVMLGPSRDTVGQNHFGFLRPSRFSVPPFSLPRSMSPSRASPLAFIGPNLSRCLPVQA